MGEGADIIDRRLGQVPMLELHQRGHGSSECRPVCTRNCSSENAMEPAVILGRCKVTVPRCCAVTIPPGTCSASDRRRTSCSLFLSRKSLLHNADLQLLMLVSRVPSSPVHPGCAPEHVAPQQAQLNEMHVPPQPL